MGMSQMESIRLAGTVPRRIRCGLSVAARIAGWALWNFCRSAFETIENAQGDRREHGFRAAEGIEQIKDERAIGETCFFVRMLRQWMVFHAIQLWGAVAKGVEWCTSGDCREAVILVPIPATQTFHMVAAST